MKMPEVRTVAKTLGIKPGNLPKNVLIKTIQLTEGNFDCFATAHMGECDQIGCCWREDCFKSARQACTAPH